MALARRFTIAIALAAAALSKASLTSVERRSVGLERSTVLRSQATCDALTGLCFEGFHDTSTNVTVGIAMPETPIGGDGSPTSYDFLIRTSFPLPYGFAGFTFGKMVQLSHRGSEFSTRATDWEGCAPDFIWFKVDPHTKRYSATDVPQISQLVAQPSMYRDSQTMAPFGNATATVSPLSVISPGHADVITRCQNCFSGDVAPAILVSDSPLTLTIMFSDSAPKYLGDGTSRAMLPLDGSVQTEFLLDTMAARFGNFSSLLRAAGCS